MFGLWKGVGVTVQQPVTDSGTGGSMGATIKTRCRECGNYRPCDKEGRCHTCAAEVALVQLGGDLLVGSTTVHYTNNSLDLLRLFVLQAMKDAELKTVKVVILRDAQSKKG
jgi:uncharacterized OB-fold protein